MELVYTLVLGTSAERLVGSSPTLRTKFNVMSKIVKAGKFVVCMSNETYEEHGFGILNELHNQRLLNEMIKELSEIFKSGSNEPT